MQQLQEDIKNKSFKQVYLLYGEETYLRLQYRDKLKNALTDPQDTMNFHYFEGKAAEVPQLIDLAETLPFFADRRVIVVENSGLFKKSADQLADYLKSMAPSACFVFVETEVDKRGRLFKAVKDVGRAVEFPRQNEATLQKWILVQLKKEGKRITQNDLQYFQQRTGTDMENISRELEKLFCYTLERDAVTREDIDAVCTRQIGNQIFDMVEAIALRRQKRALELYYDLLALKEPPMRILFLIGRQFNLLLQVKELRQKGLDEKRIAEKTGLHGFVVRKYVSQASRFSGEELREALTACAEADESVKTGRMGDTLSVELLIVTYSREKERRA
ncbi:MAG: DNA polymerase III subunit delta [Eubacteriales bacterium]|nr:DNA polymerase III subunit delta [Eubacteriales bacterium]